MSTVIECLRARGMIDGISSEELEERVKSPLKIYIGFDPTAQSLHVGNLLCLVLLRWFQKYGHTPVVILGGATGRIGDPSGKSVERPLLSEEELAHNVQSIKEQIERLLPEVNGVKPLILNNDDWLSSLSLIEFLRDVGKHFRLGAMLSKESVKLRMSSEEGMSFTEFSYQTLQGYDFYHLFTHMGVLLQAGGSDQWGNIVAGIELTRKLTGDHVFGLTFPLLTRSDGKKFGKSEAGAVWLSEEKLSPYAFYQYFMRIPDADVIAMMRLLTFMPLEEIAQVEEEMRSQECVPNAAQKRLAAEITRFVHGEKGLGVALRVTESAAPGKEAQLDPEVLRSVAQEMPGMTLPREAVHGSKFVDVAVKIGLVSSKSEAVRLIKNGGAYLNNQRIDDPALCLSSEMFLGGEFLLFAAGKRKKILLTLSKPLA